MRRKDLLTYQLKAYQDLKYRANRMTNNEAEVIDILPDVPEKRKFKPDYLKDDQDKKRERTLKLRDLSDFNKADNQQPLSDNLKEAKSYQGLNNVDDSDKKSTASNSNSTSGYNFLSRRFSLSRKTSNTHGSNVDVDVIEVSSSSSYSEDEEDRKKEKKENKKSSSIEKDTNNENKDEKSKTDSSTEINNEKDEMKTNNKVDDNKLPLDPNTPVKKDSSRILKRPNRSKNSFFNISKDDNNKYPSIDFSSFINNLTFGNNANKRNNQPPMTASNVINSIFSFLNNSIKEEKPVAPIIDTPKSPSIPDSDENEHKPDEKINSDSENDNDNEKIIAPVPVHKIPILDNQNDTNTTTDSTTNTNDNNENSHTNTNTNTNTNDNEIINNNTNDKDSTLPTIKINDDKVDINNKDTTSSEKENEENKDGGEKEENNKSLNSSRESLNSNRSNARMDFSLQPTTPEEIRKKKLTPLIVSKKGSSVLIKFLEMNINVVPEMKITEIEWVCMQNPRGTFTTKRPQCPGQRFPGLKLGRKISNLMISLAKLRGAMR